jgi:hypothetical protein
MAWASTRSFLTQILMKPLVGLDVGAQVGREWHLEHVHILQVGRDGANADDFGDGVDHGRDDAVIHLAQGVAGRFHDVFGGDDALLHADVGQDALAGGVADGPHAGDAGAHVVVHADAALVVGHAQLVEHGLLDDGRAAGGDQMESDGISRASWRSMSST